MCSTVLLLKVQFKDKVCRPNFCSPGNISSQNTNRHMVLMIPNKRNKTVVYPFWVFQCWLQQNYPTFCPANIYVLQPSLLSSSMTISKSKHENFTWWIGPEETNYIRLLTKSFRPPNVTLIPQSSEVLNGTQNVQDTAEDYPEVWPLYRWEAEEVLSRGNGAIFPHVSKSHVRFWEYGSVWKFPGTKSQFLTNAFYIVDGESTPELSREKQHLTVGSSLKIIR